MNKKCTVCDKHCSVMYPIGRRDVGLVCCKKCLSNEHFILHCGVCNKKIGSSTVPSHTITCYMCHPSRDTVNCSNCNVQLCGDFADEEAPSEFTDYFCKDCLRLK